MPYSDFEKREYMKKYKIKNREKMLETKRAHYARNKDRLILEQHERRRKNPRRYMQTYLKGQCVQRAKNQDIPCTITIDDIIIPELCPVLKIPLQKNPKGKHAWDNSPTVDKIIPSLGYTPDNIAVISHRANVVKGNSTLEELEALVAFLKSKNL